MRFYAGGLLRARGFGLAVLTAALGFVTLVFFGFSGAFLEAFHTGYSPCSFMNFSKSSSCTALVLSLKTQLIPVFSI